jgi:RNA polymerase sigma-70 factor (family 1)
MTARTDHREEALLKSLRSGSVDAFEEIFRMHWQPLYVIAKSKLHSHDDAEEVIQSIFSGLWEKREKLLITNLTFYLHTALKNRILNLIRSRITQEKYWEYYKNYLPSTEDQTENVVVFDDLNIAVEDAVKLLPEKSRQVFRLSRIEGRSNSEIAVQLHLSEKAIEYHLTKSLRHLKVHLKDFLAVVTLSFLF